ncbi:out at first protein-like [Argopecten irradians]|uniref:out at first protein-like n=1 Tax=Argopecten irradians TaxID=31199 RepID=UPI0037111037
MDTLSQISLMTFLVFIIQQTNSQLVVNVKNRGGDVVIETIQANTSNDVVQLQFQNTDGTIVHQLIDYKSEAQIFRAHVLWEEEQDYNQNKPQVLCFVTRFNKNEFISADAMSKLRQKNPTAIRQPEEERPPELHTMDTQVYQDRGGLISPHLTSTCSDAGESIYTKESDVRQWARVPGRAGLMGTVQKLYPTKYQHCHLVEDATKPCLCTYSITVGWYPCGLKYCRGKDSTGKYVSYRCGIKTCKRHLSFDFVSKQKMNCLWDEA